MRPSSKRRPDNPSGTKTGFTEQRLRDIEDGTKEAIRREVEKLEREGAPIYVWRDGKVVNLQESDQE